MKQNPSMSVKGQILKNDTPQSNNLAESFSISIRGETFCVQAESNAQIVQLRA